MASAEEPPSRGWVLWFAYLSLIFGASGTLIGTSVAALLNGHLSVSVGAFVLLAVFLVLGELRPVVASGSYDLDGVSISTAFVFAIMLIWGPAPAIVLQFVAVSLRELLMRKQWWRVCFNASQYAICLSAAASVLFMFGLRPSLQHPHLFTAGSLPAFAAAAVVYHLANLLLVGIILSIRKGSSVWAEITDEFWYYTSTTMAVVALSPVVAVVAMHSWQMIPLLLLPLFLVYKTASISLEREQQALHDALTGLANRKLLLASTSELLEDLQRHDGRVALILLDLDRFKDINDTLGHPVGDRVLQVVAARIKEAVRPGDLVARLGGDEFAVLLRGLENDVTATEVAERIRAWLHEPISLDGTLVDLDASLGIALFPDHGDDFDRLHRSADVAMYVAKASGGGVAVYDADKDTNSLARLGLLSELRQALDNGALELYYQPKISLASGEVVGVEALVRWQHPNLGLVMPDYFIPLAEQSGLMARVTDSLLDQALAQCARWDADGLRLVVAVNVSVRDLLDHGFAERVSAALARHSVDPSALVLEITERRLLADLERGAKVLAELVASGVHISLDDFGTGYSSLTLLKQLPVCELKIDQSFVSRIGDSEADATIVGSIVELAHALNLTVVAEGVETTDVLQRLEVLGCDQAQGWLVGQPMNSIDASAWIAARQHDTVRIGVPRHDPRRRVAPAAISTVSTTARRRIRP